MELRINTGNRKLLQKKEKTAKKFQRQSQTCFDGLWSCMRCLMKRKSSYQENEGASVEEDFYYAVKDEAKAPEKDEAKAAEKDEAKDPEKDEANDPEKNEANDPEKNEAKAAEKDEAKAAEKGEANDPENNEANYPEKDEAKAAGKGEAKAPEKDEAKDPEKDEAKDPEKNEANDPEKNEANDPEKDEAKATEKDEANDPEKDEAKAAEKNEANDPEKNEAKAAENDEAKAAEKDEVKAAEKDEAKATEKDEVKAPEKDEAKAAEKDEAKAAENDEAKAAEKGEAKALENDEAKDPEKDEAKDPEKNEAKAAEKEEANDPEKDKAKAAEKGEAKALEKDEAKDPKKDEAKDPEKNEANDPEKDEAKAAEKGEAKAAEKGEAKAAEKDGAKDPEKDEAKDPEKDEAKAPEKDEAKAPENSCADGVSSPTEKSEDQVTVIKVDLPNNPGNDTKTPTEQDPRDRTDTAVSDESFQTAPEVAEESFISCASHRNPSFEIEATRPTLKSCIDVPSLDLENFLDTVARFQNSRLNEQRAELPTLPVVQTKKVTFQDSRGCQVSPKSTKRKGVYKQVKFHQLEYVETLGKGSFGCVELVTLTTDRSQTFALKCLVKQHVVDLECQKQVFEEKKIMMKSDCPFMTKMYRTYKDTQYVYMLMELCLGGDLRTLLTKRGCFSDNEAQFYIGCVLLGLQYMHSRGIAHRDLKPANMLLDSRGYLKLGDFGISRKIGVGRKIISNCGTTRYMAPEVFWYMKYGTSVDFWSVGVIIYELLSGIQPFAGANIKIVKKNVLKGISAKQFAPKIGSDAEDIIKSLCEPIEDQRLGRHGAKEVKSHKWFEKFDWNSLESQTMNPPFDPQVTSPTDSHNFNKCRRRSNVPPDETSGWDKKF